MGGSESGECAGEVMKGPIGAALLSLLVNALFVWAMIESFHMPVVPVTFADDHWATYLQIDLESDGE